MAPGRRIRLSAHARALLLAVALLVLLVPAAHAGTLPPDQASWSADIAYPTTADTVGFTGFGTDPDGGGIASYQWDFNGDGTYDTAALPGSATTHQFTTPGTFTVILKVTDDDGDGSYVTHAQTITVRDNWAPQSVAVSPTASTDAYPRTGQLVSFDFYAIEPDGGTGGSTFNYSWNIDWDGNGTVDQTAPATGFITPITHQYDTPGEYIVHYSATDSDGHGAVANETAAGIPMRLVVAGNQPPAPSQVSWSATVGGTFASSANVGQSVLFTGTATDSDANGSIATYQWDFNGDNVYDTSASATDSASHSYATPGTYTVTLKVTDGDPAGGTGPGASQTYSYQFIVNATDGAQGYIYDNSNYYSYGDHVKTNQADDFYASIYYLPSGVTVSNYLWQWGDGTSNTSTAAPQTQHTYTAPGTYYPRMTATLSDGTSLVVNYAGYNGYSTYDPYTYTPGYTPLRVADNFAPAWAYAVPTTNTGCLHASQSIQYTVYGLDPDGGHIASFDIDWNSDGNFESTNVAASDATSDSATINHTYPSAGLYYITVRAHDNDGGATFTDLYNIQQVSIEPNNCAPVVQISHQPDSPQTGHTITFDASNSYDLDGTVQSYEWDWHDGSPVSTTVSPGHAYSTDGDHFFTLKITDNSGGVSYQDGVVTTHTGNHTPQWTGLYISPNQADTTDTVYFDASGYDDDGYIVSYGWDWDGNGTIEQTTSSPANSHVYSAPGIYHPRVTVYDDGSPVLSATSPATGSQYTVTVTQAQPSAQAVWTPDEPHPAQSIAFSAYTSNPYGAPITQYVWHWGDGTSTTTTVASANHTYSTAGTKSLTITVTDSLGHTSTGPAQNVGVMANWPPHAFFTVDPSCATANTSMTFDASGTTDSDSASIATYHWTFGDGNTSNTNQATTTHSYANTGVFDATVTATDSGGATSAPYHVQVTVQSTNCPPQDVYFTYSPQSLPSGSAITFTGHGTDPDGSVVSYTWSWGDGSADTISPTSGGNNTQHTFANPGQYYVQVTARDNLGATTQYHEYLLVGVDTTAPTVTLTTPAQSAATTPLPHYSGTAGNDANDSGTVTVKVYSGSSVTGSPLQTLQATRSTTTWAIDGTTALATGTYTAQAQQSDNNGNIGYSAPHTFTVDATPPSITLTTPANNSSTNDTTPTLSGTAGIASGDLSGVTVTIYNGSNTLGTVAQTPTTTRNGTTGAYTLDATALLPGTYTAQASQLDGAGNVGTSNTRTFTIDTTAPVVTLTTPANGSSTNDTTPTYSGTAGQLTGDQTAITVEIYSGTTVTGSPLQTRPATAAAGAWTVDGTTALLPGTYTARALQTDAAGNQGTSTPNTFTVDTTAPVLTLTTPANGNRTNVTTPTYSGAAGNATGDSATVTLDIYSGSTVTGSPVQSRPATRVGATWTIDGSPALTAGTYTARATQTDAAGNSGHSGDNTFVVDTTAPTITLTAPANASSTPDNTPTFSGVAGITTGDNAAVAVKVYAGTGTGGTLLQTLNATRNGTTGAYTVDASSGLPDGTYTAQASQDDSAGNTGNSSANTFTVNGPPVVTLTTPADGAVLGTHTPSIGGARGTAAGDLQTVTVHIYSGTGTGGTEVQTPTDSGSGSTWGVTPTSLADGTYTVQATQSDGSLTGTSAAHTFRVDTTAPNVAITAPADGSRISDATPAISGTAGTATGDASTVSVKLYNGTGTGGTLLQTLTPTVGGTGGWTTSATTLPQGTYTAQATQSDNASPANTGTSTPVTFTVDTTAPTVTLATPPTTRSTDTTPTFSGTGSTDPTDNPTVTVRVFSGTSASGSAVQTFTPTLSGGNYTVDSPGLGNGTYTAQTSQGDQAGNVGHSTSRTFTVDTAAPSVTLTAPADGSSSTESSPTFSGAAGTAAGDNSGVTVKVFSGSAPSGSALQTLSATQSGGAWSVPASAPLAPGTYTAQAEQSDDMGHTGKSSANTFTITAPVVVTPPPSNNAPACTNGTANVPNATATSVTLSCTDGDGDPLTLSIVSGPGHGTVGAVDQAAKSVTYTPASAFSGADSFTFKANDGKADSNAATISLTVAAPVVIPPGAIGKAIKLPPPGIIKTVLNGNTPASANFGTGVCPPACFIVIQLFPAGQAPKISAAAKLGAARFTVAPGKKVPLTVKLTKKATAQLKKKGKLKITAVIKTVDAAGHTTTIKRNYTLKVTKKR